MPEETIEYMRKKRSSEHKERRLFYGTVGATAAKSEENNSDGKYIAHTHTHTST